MSDQRTLTSQGIGPVIDVVDVPTTTSVRVTITTGGENAAAAPALAAGLYGTLMRAVYAHGNQDVDRSNPDSNSPGPAYLSQLSAVGIALEKLADPSASAAANADAGGFTSVVAQVPALLANATSELEKKLKKGNGRVNYTLALLK